MSMNLSTVAKLAGVSVSTVSKAFSGSAEISEETKQRIFAIARQQGIFDKYYKNSFPKKVIGVICPEIISNYYATLVSMLNREIEAHNGITVLSLSSFQPSCNEELFSYFSYYCKVDGIILLSQAEAIKNPSKIPTVALYSEACSEEFDTISTTLPSAIEKTVLYLKELGHTKIGFAGEPLTSAKQIYFENAMRKAVLPLRKEWIQKSDLRFENAGIDAAKSYLGQKEHPTAILAAYDYIAIGLIKALKEQGLRIPEDISIIGIDDIAVAPYLETSLSSIHMHHAEACHAAVEILLKKLKNQYYSTKKRITIEAEFIPRASSGAAPTQFDTNHR